MASSAASLADLRRVAKEQLSAILAKISHAPPKDAETAAARLERAAYNSSVHAAWASPQVPHLRHYERASLAAREALQEQVGPHPDDIRGLVFMRGGTTADALLADSLSAAAPEPREVVRRMFVRSLMAAHERYAADRDCVLSTARAIEVSCYNAVVRASKESEDPLRRNWDSPDFVDIYSTRCGTINGLLDPDSSACRAYGASLVPRLVSGALAPEALGSMTSKELCPQATEAERLVIARRTAQRIEKKESNLFRCPHCSAWRCTYREVQRRSLDEAPSYLCVCGACGRRFNGG